MKTVKLTKETIDEIFKKANEQADYVINLYKLAFPKWDDIKHVDGYPKVSKTTSEYLFEKAIIFDREKHPNVMNGGLWLDKGFALNEEVKDWEVSLNGCVIEH